MELQRLVDRVVEARLSTFSVTTEQYHSGPLPTAEQTEKYELIHPGFTDRWIAMSEREQEMNHGTVKRRDVFGFIHSLCALVVTTLIILTFVGGGVFLIHSGKSMEGFGTIGVAIASVIGALRYRATHSEGKK